MMKLRCTLLGLLAMGTIAAVGCKTLKTNKLLGPHHLNGAPPMHAKHMPHGPHPVHAALGVGAPEYNLPPAQMLMHPGPGVDGPGPGVMMAGGAVDMAPGLGENRTSQLAFISPNGMVVNWDVSGPGTFDSEPLVVPGRQNFSQAAIYRLKLTNIPGRAGLELYPTIEVGPATPRTDAYLAHNAIPIQFTEEDLDQVQSGNFVTKVIYLPDPEFQELALAGVETLVSTRLDPGVDPIVEADRRGSIMAIIRLGNKDLQVPAADREASAGMDGSVMRTQYGEYVESGEMGGGYEYHEAHVEADGGAHHGGQYGGQYGANAGGPFGASTSTYQPGATPPNLVSGVTTPQWGMPMSGTPIGLPGPPHIPLGIPAGLQKHVITNHTHVHMPPPVDDFHIKVKQKPGFSYPKPVSGMSIKETAKGPYRPIWNPFWNKKEIVTDGHHH